MSFDWSINVGNVITVLCTLLGFGVGAVGLYFWLKSNVDKLAFMMELFGGRIINVENELKAMRDVLVKVSVQDERLSSMDQRLDELTRRFNREHNGSS